MLQKIRNSISLRRCAAICVLGVLIAIKITGVLSAQSVTRAYGSDQVLRRGMIVGLDEKDGSKVVPIDTTKISSILGVVVNPNDSPISVSADNKQIFVATSGRYDVLVSDQEGAIAATDYVTLSAIGGIGMKATDEQRNILGRAITEFDGVHNVLSTASLTDGKGGQRPVHIGTISVEVAVAKNPLAKSDNGAPLLLNKAAEAIAGKAVSALRLYLSAIIFIVGTIIAGVILYAGIKSGIISIGRNPLSKKSIVKSVTGVYFLSLIVFVISIIAVYLLLKL